MHALGTQPFFSPGSAMVSRVTGDRRINQGLAPDVVMACCGNVRGLSDVEFEELFNRD